MQTDESMVRFSERWNASFRAYAPSVRRRLRAEGLSPDETEDALQDVFLIALRRNADYDPSRGTIAQWLGGIARRVGRARRHKSSRWRPLETEVLDERSRRDLELAVEVEGLREAIAAIRSGLSPEDWDVFELAEFEGLGGKEIAERLGIGLNAAYSRLSRARKRIRELARARQTPSERRWLAGVALGMPRSIAVVSLSAAALMVLALVVAIMPAAGPGAGRDDADVEASGEAQVRASPAVGSEGTRRPKWTSAWLERRRRETTRIDAHILSRGEPVPATACLWERTSTTPRCVRTDAKGQASFDALTPGSYRLTAYALGHGVGQHGGLLPRYIDLSDPGGFLAEVELEEGAKVLRGEVFDVTGGPVAGALVVARQDFAGVPKAPTHVGATGQWPPVATWTDDDGQFALLVPPEERVLLEATMDGYASGGGLSSVHGPAHIILIPASAIEGRVLDPSGRPVAEASVAVAGWPERSTVTDSAGTFVLTGLPPGTFSVQAWAEGLRGEAQVPGILGMAETLVGVDVHASKSAFAYGTVNDSSGQACPNALVAVDGPSAAVVTADVEGRFVFPSLMTGVYRFVWSCPTGETGSKQGVIDATDVPLELRTRPGVTVRGLVEAPEELDLGRSIVWAEPVTSAESMALPMVSRVRDDGSFEFPALGDAPHRFSVSGPAIASGNPVQLDPNHRFPPRLKVSRGGRIEGRGGSGLVELVDGFGSVRLAPIDASGRFVFERVSPGPVTLMPVGMKSSTAIRVRLGEGETLEVDLESRSEFAMLEGRVTDVEGHPIADVLIQATEGRPSGQRDLPFEFRRGRLYADPPLALTDDAGRFFLMTREDADYRITAWQSGGRLAVADEVRAGEKAHLRIAPAGAARGRVLDATGETVDAFSVEAIALSLGLVYELRFEGTEGQWRLDDLVPDRYRFVVRTDAGTSTLEATIEPDDSTRLDLQIDAPRRLCGSVVDVETRRGIEDVLVLADPPHSNLDRLFGRLERALFFGAYETEQVSDRAGGFCVDAPPGDVRLLLVPRAAEAASHFEAVTVLRSTELSEPLMIELAPRPPDPGAVGTPGFELVQGDVGSAHAVEHISRDELRRQGLAIGDELVAVDGQSVVGPRWHLAEGLLEQPRGTVLELRFASGLSLAVPWR